MPPIGVGEGWKGTIAEKVVLDLNGTHAHDLPIIEKALGDAVDQVAEGARSVVSDLRLQVKDREAAIIEINQTLADVRARAATDQALLNSTIQARDKTIGEQDEELARLKGPAVPEAPPTGLTQGGASAAVEETKPGP